ncbi:MAG: glycosyltransferase family 2 protein [Cyanobacteria bacterium]|nr:glycosyltransferase family 2 protein [Cyanobacteriota bacterium]
MVGGSPNDHRRGKAAVYLFVCLLLGALPHGLPQGPAMMLGRWALPLLGVLIGTYALRTVGLGARAVQAVAALAPGDGSRAQTDQPSQQPPTAGVDVVVAARDEEAVIGRLVERLTALRWPHSLLRIWIIDDGSEDRTAERLVELQQRHPQLQVVRRSRQAGGGKSAALNEVLQRLQGRWMLVLDADADMGPDLLERLIPFAEAGGWAAVQLRKAEVNSDQNWLTRGQAMEMAFDAVVQEGRLAQGGVVELRGNGQLLRRDAVQTAGGFNEATITDDLDLSFRLLLAGLPIGVLWNPPICEEAVPTLPALWRQRQRWAEGGLQRYLDYGPQLLSNRLNGTQKLDLTVYFLLQYVLPVVAIVDGAAAVLTATRPAFWPFSLVAVALTLSGMAAGCRRASEGPALPDASPGNLVLGIVHMMHWFVVIPWVTLKMALLPKKLVWAKTTHKGLDVEEGLAMDLNLLGQADADGEIELATD